MAVTHGMNIEEVRALGRRLQTEADHMRNLIAALNSAVASTTWVGPDATEFKGPWWDGHKGQLTRIAEDLQGFGQSAMNNASEQEQISNR